MGTYDDCRNALYDLSKDPGQLQPIHEPEVEARLLATMTNLLHHHDAPSEAYSRIGLVRPT